MGGFPKTWADPKWEKSHPSPLSLGLESRLGLGLSLGSWEGWAGGFQETWADL